MKARDLRKLLIGMPDSADVIIWYNDDPEDKEEREAVSPKFWESIIDECPAIHITIEI